MSTGAPRSDRKADLGWAAALATGAVLVLLAALWVPINRRPVPDGYYHLDLRSGLQPRALAGTVAHVLGLPPVGFVRMGLASELLFVVVLLHELSVGTPTRSGRAVAALAGTAALLTWFQVVFPAHFFSGFVDVHSHLLLLLAWVIASRGDEPPSSRRLAVVVAVSVLSLLNHEKALFDAALLATWMWWRWGARRAVAFATPVGAAFLLLVATASEDTRIGLPFYEYLRRFATFESDSVIGVFWAGGAGWALLLWAGTRVVRDDRTPTGRTLAYALASAAICFAQLLVAHDTSRLLGSMWFPTLVLLRRMGFASQLRRPAATAGVAVLLLLQLALPPLFVFEHRAVPLNCYAQKSLRRMVGVEGDARLETLVGMLRLSEDGGHRPFYVRRCDDWAVYRNAPRHRWW